MADGKRWSRGYTAEYRCVRYELGWAGLTASITSFVFLLHAIFLLNSVSFGSLAISASSQRIFQQISRQSVVCVPLGPDCLNRTLLHFGPATSVLTADCCQAECCHTFRYAAVTSSLCRRLRPSFVLALWSAPSHCSSN